MKKTLLSLAFVLFGLSLSAANIELNWNAFMTSVTTATADVKSDVIKTDNGDVSVTFCNANQITTTPNKVNELGLYRKQGSKPAGYVEFVLPIDCSSIVLVPSNYANATAAVAVYADDNLISGQGNLVVGNAGEKSVAVEGDYQKAGTKYKVLFKAGTVRFAETNFVEAVTSEATLKVSESALSFAAPLKATQALTLKGEAKNIDGDIAVSVDNEAFTVPATITADQLAAGFDVTFTAAAVGESTATLTLAAGELKETVALTAVAVAHEGTETDPLTVADVIALNNLNPGPFYITGTIGDKSLNSGLLDEPNKYSIILTGENDSYIAVNFGANDDAAMEKLNIVDNSDNIGKTVVIKGELKALSNGAPGVWSPQYISGLPDTETGIAGIEADNNAPVEYFNLQGIRVANPENGLYIRRQGNKVTKVYVK